MLEVYFLLTSASALDKNILGGVKCFEMYLLLGNSRYLHG